MKVAIVYDPTLEPDSSDTTARTPRRMGEFLDSREVDVLIVWREFGEQFTNGSRTHVIPTGAWENITNTQIEDVLSRIGELA